MRLTIITFLPLAAALAIALVPRAQEGLIRRIALVATGLTLGVTAWLVATFNTGLPGMQCVEQYPWIPPLGISYHLGVDGLSLPLVFLTGLLGFLACLASSTIRERVKEYYILYLILETGMLGTFVALDLVLFYVFWEVTLVPMYFLIGIWGGPKREYAAMKFFLYTLAGSIFMLLSILAVYFASSPSTFNGIELMNRVDQFSPAFQRVVCLGFFLAFAIKVPTFPFHTWLPDAHVEAPTPISVLLAGVLLKMGGYGFFRFGFPLFPDAAAFYAWPIALIGVIGIIYGAFVAMAQTDFKRLVAYSSVSHMGFVMLGLAAQTLNGFQGAVFQMFSHGLITGAMFLMVGVLYERTHTRDLTAFGGLGAKIPGYAGWLSLFSFASLGLPGMSGFVSEFLVLLGSFGPYQVFTIIAVLGIVVTAGYLLYTVQRVLLGPLNPKWAGLPDMTPAEVGSVLPLAIGTLIVGLYPMVLIQYIQPTLAQLLDLLRVP